MKLLIQNILRSQLCTKDLIDKTPINDLKVEELDSQPVVDNMFSEDQLSEQELLTVLTNFNFSSVILPFFL